MSEPQPTDVSDLESIISQPSSPEPEIPTDVNAEASKAFSCFPFNKGEPSNRRAKRLPRDDVEMGCCRFKKPVEGEDANNEEKPNEKWGFLGLCNQQNPDPNPGANQQNPAANPAANPGANQQNAAANPGANQQNPAALGNPNAGVNDGGQGGGNIGGGNVGGGNAGAEVQGQQLKLKALRIMIYSFFVCSTAVMMGIWTGTRSPNLAIVLSNGVVFILAVALIIALELFTISNNIIKWLTFVLGGAIITLGVIITCVEASLCKQDAPPPAPAPAHAPFFPPSQFSG